MRHSNNIFEGESRNGKKLRMISGTTVASIILSAISFFMGIWIITNYEEISARIAIWMAGFLTSGFLILLAVIAIIYLYVRFKCRVRRHFWGW